VTTPRTDLHLDLDTDLNLAQHGRADGPDLLLVHGLTDSGAGWAQAVEHWERSYRVTTLDLRGHGESPRFTREQLEAHPGDLMVEDVTRVVMQLQRPVMIGHSLGGAVALALGASRPDLVRALVLEDPAPRSPDDPQRDRARGREYHEGLEASRQAQDDAALLQLRREVHPHWPEAELLPTGHAEQQTQADYLLGGDWRPTTPWPELLASLQVPTLLITGGRLDDVIVSPELEAEMLAAAPGVLVVHRLEEAGHCVRRDRQDLYYSVVDEWLASV
jgi:pimeloyl-ACP methyl ester carboxylesterase